MLWFIHLCSGQRIAKSWRGGSLDCVEGRKPSAAFNLFLSAEEYMRFPMMIAGVQLGIRRDMCWLSMAWETLTPRQWAGHEQAPQQIKCATIPWSSLAKNEWVEPAPAAYSKLIIVALPNPLPIFPALCCADRGPGPRPAGPPFPKQRQRHRHRSHHSY